MSEKKKIWQDRPIPPFNAHLGFEVDDWSPGRVRIVADVKPEHCNYSGLPHGGFIATMLDAATALAGVYPDNPEVIQAAFTLSLNISFVGQAQTTDLYAEGKVTASGGRIFYSQAEVRDAEDNLLATAQGVFRYRPPMTEEQFSQSRMRYQKKYKKC